MKTILITGGNGFLGSHIVRSLINNYSVIVLEKNSDNLFRLSDIANQIKIYDIDNVSLEIIFQENSVDLILHTATVYGRNNESLETILQANLTLPLSLYKLGAKYKSKAFINTDTVLDRNVSPYALTKAHLREWLQMYSNELKVINMQLEHFYGPGGSMDNFISLMVQKMLLNIPYIDLTLGEQKRDFLYFDDVVSAFITVINNCAHIDSNFTNLQIASGEVVSIRNVVETIRELTNSNSILNFGAIPYRLNELMEPNTSNSTICELGWKPMVNLEEGLKRTVEYIKTKID
jgi:nucleoside-diphosphate-sugar epimerase